MKPIPFLLSCGGFLLFATAASAQVQVDKQLQMTGSAPADRQIKNVGDAAQATDAVNAQTLQAGKLNYAVASNSGNAFSLSLTPGISTYTPGMIINFKVTSAISGAATLNVNGLGAKSIKKQVTNDLAANDIVSGQLVSVIYDGTNFQMLSQLGNSTTISPTPQPSNSQTLLYLLGDM